MSVFEEFPLPDDPVALLDIDGTLLDNRYEITDDQIYPAIQTAQEHGWLLGLSSDSPYEAMTLWRKRLGTNGPLIAERGALAEAAGSLIYDNQSTESFKQSGQALHDYFCSIGATVKYCNPVEFLREIQTVGQPGDLVVLINNLRRSSLSFFVRTVDDEGRLSLAEAATAGAAEQARQFYPPMDDLVEDLNHEYGLVIVSRRADSKRLGTKRIMSEVGANEVAMIGNSMDDFIGKDIARHYAVANAAPEFKERSDYIASVAFTGGVVEILGNLTLSSEK